VNIRSTLSAIALSTALLVNVASPASALEEDRNKCSIGMSGCSIIHIAPGSDDPTVYVETPTEPDDYFDDYTDVPAAEYFYYGTDDDYGLQYAYYGGIFGSCNFNVSFDDGTSFRGQVEIYSITGTAEVRLRAYGAGQDPSRLVRINTTERWAVSFCDRHGGDWR
jgi:hypothetical protein